jgi:exosortase/archaeosortase family protein
VDRTGFLRRYRQRLRFGLVFLLCLGSLGLAFARWEPWFATGSIYPVSRAAAWLLELTGVPVVFDSHSLALGFCSVLVGQVSLRVIHECTGLFALFIYLAAVAAYPSPLTRRLWGIALGVPAFLVYSSLRLAVLGWIAHLVPGWLEFFHLYLLVSLNLGFAVFLWLYWMGRARHAA